MELTDLHIELLEKKHLNKLSDDEIQELLVLEQNPEFVDEAAKYLALFEGIVKDSKQEIKDKLNQWESEQKNQTPIRKLNWNKLMKFAAILVVSIGGLFYVSQMFTSSSNDLSEFYEAYPNRVTTRAGSEDSTLTEAMALYSDKNYKDCKLSLLNRTDETAMFYIANCSFNMQEYRFAIEEYRRVIIGADSNSKWTETAEWYLLLSKLQLDEFNKSATSFEKLQEMSKSKHPYNSQARSLLLRLENIK